MILCFVLLTARSTALFALALEDVVHLGGLEGNVPAPDAEASLGVDAPDPQVQRGPLCPVLLRVLALDLQRQ
jgi:hypothetical protein